MTRRRKMHAAALSLLILTTVPGFALLCRGHSPSRFATPNLPFWERTLPRPVPPRVAMRGFLPLPGGDDRSVARLMQTDPDELFAMLEHPSRSHPSGAGRPGVWLLSACARDHPSPSLRRQQDRVAARLMDAQRDDGYLAAGVGAGRWSREQIAAHSENLRGLLAYYAVSHGPASIYAAMQAGDLVVTQFPSVTSASDGVGSLVLPVTLLYQATGEQRYRRWAESRAAAGLVDGPGLCALYAATGRARYLNAAHRIWEQESACRRTDPALTTSLWVLTGGREYHATLHTLSALEPCPIIPGCPNDTRSLSVLHISATLHSPFSASHLAPHTSSGLHHGGG